MGKRLLFGCLSIVLLFVVLIGGVVGVAMMGAEKDWDWSWSEPLADVAWEGNYGGAYEITAVPDTAVAYQPIAIQATGLNPGQLVGIRAEAVDRDGITWASAALFAADEDGHVDVASMAPQAGSYEGLEPMGLFWSMRPTSERDLNRFGTGGEDYTVTLSLEAAGETLATTNVVRLLESPDLVREEVDTETVRGVFYHPPSETPLPAIMLIGGSDGGIPEREAALWASQGYAALAVGYFGVEGLPTVLSKIPLERFDDGLAWLQAQPSVDPEQVVIQGTSRGSEAALLTAIEHPELMAVIVVVPSSMVWSGLDFSAAQENQGQIPSAWTRNGDELPANANTFTMGTFRTMIGQPASLYSTFEAGLDSPAEGTIIEVEKIEAPILLISATADDLWPSTDFADQIVARLEANNFAYEVEHVALEGAGHVVLPTWQPPLKMVDTLVLGGSREANGRSTGLLWQSKLDFLARQ